MKRWMWLAVLAFTSCSSDSGGSNTGVGDFSDPAACEDCEIELAEVAVLGNASDHASVWEGAGQFPCVVGRMNSGESLVSAPVGGGEILVFGDGGRITRTIGRPGGGPGEFGSQLRFVVGAGDTVHVLDEENARLQTLDSSGDYIRSIALPSRVRTFALLATGDILVQWAPEPRSAEPLPLFTLYSSSGEEVQTIGKHTPEPGRSIAWTVSPAPNGGFWEANTRRYEINLRGIDGTVRRTIRRAVEWFPPDAEPDPGFPMAAPAPTALDHVWDDGEGLLWVYLQRPDDEWEPLSSPPGATPEVGDLMFDTMIEVLDIKNSRLVTSLRLDKWYGSACGANLLYRVFYTESGDTRVRVIEPRLVGY